MSKHTSWNVATKALLLVALSFFVGAIWWPDWAAHMLKSQIGVAALGTLFFWVFLFLRQDIVRDLYSGVVQGTREFWDDLGL